MLLDTFVSGEVPAADAAHALSESCLLAVYEVQDYKHKSNEPDQELKSVCAVTEEDLREVLPERRRGIRDEFSPHACEYAG